MISNFSLWSLLFGFQLTFVTLEQAILGENPTGPNFFFTICTYLFRKYTRLIGFQKTTIWSYFHLVFLSHDNIVILSDDTNGVGEANLTPLICLLLHHHQLTSLILLHHHRMTSARA